MNKMNEKYNIDCILRGGNVIRERRGVDKVHYVYVVIFNNKTEIEVLIPHYFESVGKERLFIKEIEAHRLKNRRKKINKIICTRKKLKENG